MHWLKREKKVLFIIVFNDKIIFKNSFIIFQADKIFNLIKIWDILVYYYLLLI